MLRRVASRELQLFEIEKDTFGTSTSTTSGRKSFLLLDGNILNLIIVRLANSAINGDVESASHVPKSSLLHCAERQGFKNVTRWNLPRWPHFRSAPIILRIKSTRYFLQNSLNFNDLKACYFTTPRDEFHFLFASFLKCRSAYWSARRVLVLKTSANSESRSCALNWPLKFIGN